MQTALTTTGSGPAATLLSKPDADPAGGDAILPAVPARPGKAALQVSSASQLDRRQKAAIIVRLMLGEASVLPLDEFESRQMVSLVRAMAELRHVNQAATLQVISEFLAEFQGLGLTFRPGLEGALSHLDGHVSTEVADLLGNDRNPGAPLDPWAEIARFEVSDLIQVLMAETPQVTAIAMAKLPAPMAAEILTELPGEIARAVALAAVSAGRISQPALANVGNTILQGLQSKTDQGALPGDPLARMAAILNFASGDTRQAMLDALESDDAAMSERVRRIMFTFGDIPDRIEVKDIPKLARAVENETLITALAGAAISEKETAEFILGNLSKRLAEQIREEIREIGEVKVKDADAAMNKLVAGIRELEASGEITLISPEE